MAPEQAKGDALDHRADLFSLGSVLYALAAGRPPFRAATTFAVLKRVVDDDPRPLREVIPELPQWLADVIAKLHAKNPVDRFQSAREVADVLADYEGQLKSQATVKSHALFPAPAPPRGNGRWKWAVAASLLLPLVALAVTEGTGLTHFVGSRRPEPPPEGMVKYTEPPTAVAPFDTARAKEHQEAWAGSLGVPVELTNSIGMKLRLIPPGEFMMGMTAEEIAALTREANDRQAPNLGWLLEHIGHSGPARRVRLMKPYYVGANAVTVGQFRAFAEAAGYKTDAERRNEGAEPAEPTWQTGNPADDRTASFLSWVDAAAFCK
jgi:hypothetical protein